MMTGGARPPSQLIVGMYSTAPSYCRQSNTRETVWGITYRYCLVLDRFDTIYSKPKTYEHDDDPHNDTQLCRSVR